MLYTIIHLYEHLLLTFCSKRRLWIRMCEFCLQLLHILLLCTWLYNLNFTIITSWIQSHSIIYTTPKTGKKSYLIFSVFNMFIGFFFLSKHPDMECLSFKLSAMKLMLYISLVKVSLCYGMYLCWNWCVKCFI